MGNGTSTCTLSTEERAAVVKALKVKMEALSSPRNSEEIINAELTKEYNDLVLSFSKSNIIESTPTTSTKTVLTLPEICLSSVSNSSIATPTPKSLNGLMRKGSMIGRTANDRPHYATGITRKSIDLTVRLEPNSSRRRSFAEPGGGAKAQNRRRMSVAKVSNNTDGIMSPKSPKSPVENSTPITDIIAAAEAAVEDLTRPADSWESVTQQPFCTLCQMTFKSMGFLDRHTKYSDIHAKKLLASQDPQDSMPAIATPSVQEEGVHYRLLYHGSKFFWKQQKSIDFDIYFHILANVLEVVAFDVERHKELQRIYLDGVSVEQIIESALQDEVREKKKLLSRDRFAIIPSDAVLREDLKRNLLTSTILQRLQLHSDISNISYETGLVFVTNTDDACKHNPCLEKPPSVLIPVLMEARRRKSTASEINNAISSLRTDSEDISQYLLKANKLLLTRQASTQFTIRADSVAKIVFDVCSFLRKPKWYSFMSRLRRKFIWAVRRVIRAQCVSRVKAMVESGQIKRQLKRQMTLRRGASVRAKEV